MRLFPGKSGNAASATANVLWSLGRFRRLCRIFYDREGRGRSDVLVRMPRLSSARNRSAGREEHRAACPEDSLTLWVARLGITRFYDSRTFLVSLFLVERSVFLSFPKPFPGAARCLKFHPFL